MHKWSAKKHKMQISKQKLCFVFELFPETQYLQLCNYGIRHATLNNIQIQAMTKTCVNFVERERVKIKIEH